MAAPIAMAAGILVIGCTATVSLVSEWTDPGFSGPPKTNVLVVGITRRPQERTTFEYELKNDLEQKGVKAFASIDGLPGDVKLDKNTFEQYFGDKGFDAVLITSLMSADTTQEYVPGMTYTTPVGYGYGGGWYGYYNTVWTVQSTPGYWTQKAEFVIESNLYGTSDSKLIWRGVSKAVNPDDALQVIEQLSKKLVEHMGADGVLAVKKK
jgi:hypothetical protein